MPLRVVLMTLTLSLVLLASALVHGTAPALADPANGIITPGSGPLTSPFTVQFTGFHPNTPLTLSGSFNGGQSWFNAATAFTPAGLTTDGQGNANATLDANTLRILHDIAAGVNSPATPSAGTVIYFGSTPPVEGPEQYRTLKTGQVAACDDSACESWSYTVITRTGRTESPIVPTSGAAACNAGLAQWNASTPAERAAAQVVFDILRSQCSVGLIPMMRPPA